MKNILQRLRQFKDANKGSVLVETAFALPVFFLMAFGTIEYGMIMYMRGLVSSAVIDSSQYIMTGNNPTLTSGTPQTMQQFITSFVSQRLSAFANSSSVQVSACPYAFIDINTGTTTQIANCGGVGMSFGGTGDELVRYTVSYNWNTLDPLLVPIIGSTVPITATTVIKTESF